MNADTESGPSAKIADSIAPADLTVHSSSLLDPNSHR